MIDLHSHTTASDGQHPPEELVRRAHAAGVTTLAVTDHDTVAAIAEASAAAMRCGLTLVPGIELSAFVSGREVHVLGHFVDPAEPRLAGFSRFLRAERAKRMAAMLERLRALGVRIGMEEVVARSGGQNLGRPHLARVLVDRGEARDMNDAFDRYLGTGKAAFVQRYALSSADAIALIRGARGTATVAHPAVSRLSREDIALMKSEGLSGLEVFHPDHSPEVRSEMLGLSRELDLVPTAGSDFHGEAVVAARRLGTANMDPADLERLRTRAA